MCLRKPKNKAHLLSFIRVHYDFVSCVMKYNIKEALEDLKRHRCELIA